MKERCTTLVKDDIGIECEFGLRLMSFASDEWLDAVTYAAHNGGMIWTWRTKAIDLVLPSEELVIGIERGPSVIGYVVIPTYQIDVDTSEEEDPT